MPRIFLLSFFLLLALLIRLFLEPKSSYRAGQEVRILTTLANEPQVSPKSQRFWTEEEIEVVTNRYPLYHYGDRLRISGIIEEEEAIPGNSVNVLLKMKGADMKLIFPQIELVEEKKGNWFFETVFSLRQKLISNYEAFLPEPASSLLVGIVLGVKTQMNPDFKESLRKTGLTHVVVASGMNVTLVAGFLSAISTFFLRRRITFPFILLGIFFYSLLAGFEPPIIRAAIMGSLAFLAQALGRQNWAAFSLVLTGFLMLLLKPLLLFDLGFQLSFLATAGLIFIKPQLGQIRGIGKAAKFPLLGEGLTTTFSAQLATLPVILVNFGSFPLLSLLANTLVLWTIPWIMGLGGIVGMIGLVLKPLGEILTFIVYPFLFYFEKVSFFFARPSILSAQVGGFPLPFSLAYFAFLISVLLWLAKVRGSEENEKRGK